MTKKVKFWAAFNRLLGKSEFSKENLLGAESAKWYNRDQAKRLADDIQRELEMVVKDFEDKSRQN